MELNKNEINIIIEILNNIIKKFPNYIYYIDEYYTYEEREEYKDNIILLKNKFQDMFSNKKKI